jgi:hypothetical protein
MSTSWQRALEYGILCPHGILCLLSAPVAVAGAHDLILSIGQIVPHEALGMSGYTKNLFIGTTRGTVGGTVRAGTVGGTVRVLYGVLHGVL